MKCPVAYFTKEVNWNSAYWGRAKIASISQIFWNVFSWMKTYVSLKISLKFVLNLRSNNIPALVQIVAWRRPGDKPLSEPVMVCLLTHICVTRPQWVKATKCHVAYITEEINWNLTKPPFSFSGGLVKLGLTSLSAVEVKPWMGNCMTQRQCHLISHPDLDIIPFILEIED